MAKSQTKKEETIKVEIPPEVSTNDDTQELGVPARLASKEDLKLKKAPNKISTVYNILFSVPISWVDTPIKDSFVAANFINNEPFRILGFYSGVVYIKDVVDKRVHVQFSIEEGYINNFYNALRKLPDDAQIIKEQERG
jgi:hypothetical protein